MAGGEPSTPADRSSASAPDVRPLAPACARRATTATDVRADEQPTPPHGRSPATPTTAQPDRLVYTIREAALALRISRTKLYELLDSGQIESVHIGRSRKIPADALRTYLDHLREEQHRKAD